jgi:lipoprotein-anchoring transpeptidase ErfK/SrfK
MKFRSVALFGLGVGLAFIGPAVAAAPPAGVPSVAAVSPAAVAEVTTQAAEPAPVKKKKKLPAQAKSKKAKPLTPEQLAAKAKADQKKKLEAAAKARAVAQAKLAAKAKAEKERKLAAAKAEKAKRLAEKKQAEADRRLARAKASEQRKLAKLRAEESRRQAVARAAEDARRAEASRLMAMEVARTGNNGELRSEIREPVRNAGLFDGLFGGAIREQSMQQSMLPETRALDAVLEQKQGNRKFQVRSDFEPQVVSFPGYRRDTIVIDTGARFLYLVESSSRARRYAIAVGREGLEFKGSGKIGDKQEWPRWIPTLDMQKREPEKYAQYKDGMPGGPENPLGARAMYVYQGGKDTHIRIHGTNQPQTIGTNSSNGCFRMINEHVMDLYRRVRIGADVIVM